MSKKEKIEESRSELNSILDSGASDTSEILRLSQELDALILDYHKNFDMQ